MAEQALDKLTERIIACAFKVSNTLGTGFVEKVYENAHAHEMIKDGLRIVQQHPIKVCTMARWLANFLQIYSLRILSWLN